MVKPISEYKFCRWMAEDIESTTNLRGWDAENLAFRTMLDFGVRFGHKGYAWDREAARTLVEELVLAYAEPRP